MLTQLPADICRPSSLQELSFKSLRTDLALPKHSGRLTQLQQLSLDGCFSLEELLRTLGDLRNLK